MQSAALYSDFGSLAELRTDARRDGDSSIRDVAAQFESLFVQMMLKSMREATIEGGLFESHSLESYEQMYDQQLSLELSKSGGIGLADVLVEQLSSERGVKSRAAQSNPEGLPLHGGPAPGSLPMDAYRERALRAMELSPVRAPSAVSDAVPERGIDTAAAASPRLESPQDFVDAFRPLAEESARSLGVDPAVLLAQAALETGWGRHVTAGQGGSSNNLFNIKAGAGWEGDTVSVSTLEYRDGVAVRESAEFRAYASPQQSFQDYVDFIESSPRYRKAVEKAADGEGYLRELQAAGYATDPAYADKILAIMARGDLDAAG
ncbi:MAG: flagellar assembly peptidoglycan hydrolase FlgJ [Pseudomonadota bacterium]